MSPAMIAVCRALSIVCLLLAGAPPAAAQSAATPAAEALASQVAARAEEMPRLHAMIVARNGEPLLERAFRGPDLDRAVNVKSLSKTVLSALAGIAIERGVLEGVDQRIAPLLPRDVPEEGDPRLQDITIGHLLAMRSGLERTSGANYGRWVSSPNWVRYALSRPFVDEPGGRMLYSTGNSHVLSAILTKESGRSTLDLAREWLGEPLGVTIPAWPRDGQGVYFGGNDMALSPRALVRIGEMYRLGGMAEGRRVLSQDWICASWTPQARSQSTGHAYGYGWFMTEAAGHTVYYGWGFGGQMLYVVPSLGLTIAATSDPTQRSGGGDGYARQLHDLVADLIVPAAARDGASAAAPACGNHP